MAAFAYRAVDRSGRMHSGVIEAASALSARQDLRARGLLPLQVAASRISRDEGSERRRSMFGIRAPLRGRELALVTRQLATLIGSGMRVEDSLKTVSDGNGPRTATVLLNVRAAVLDGMSFGQALAEYPTVFSAYYRVSVAAGEQAGQLAQVMEHLAVFTEAQARNAQNIKLALIYPALLALVSLGIITLLMVYVVPDVVGAIAARGADLPWPTRLLIGASAIVRDGSLPILCALGLALFALRGWAARPENRLRIDSLLAHWSITAGLISRLNAARFAGTLAILVQSGVPLTDSLVAAAAASPNRLFRHRLENAAARIRDGSSLHAALASSGAFSPMLLAMVASGEAGGRLGDALAQAAADQERDLEGWTQTVVALIEPAILLVMGAVVLFMVLAILLPIMAVNDLAGI